MFKIDCVWKMLNSSFLPLWSIVLILPRAHLILWDLSSKVREDWCKDICFFLQESRLSALEAKLSALESQRSVQVSQPGQVDGLDRQCCSINAIPSSCQDLQKIGYTLSGIYSVKGNNNVQSVYCDFTKSANSTSMNSHKLLISFIIKIATILIFNIAKSKITRLQLALLISKCQSTFTSKKLRILPRKKSLFHLKLKEST